jgi:hypothetical protein
VIINEISQATEEMNRRMKNLEDEFKKSKESREKNTRMQEIIGRELRELNEQFKRAEHDRQILQRRLTDFCDGSSRYHAQLNNRIVELHALNARAIPNGHENHFNLGFRYRQRGQAALARDHYEAYFLQHPANQNLKVSEMSHYRFACGGCGINNIRGVMFMCSACSHVSGFYLGFDLCKECYERRSGLHNAEHLFLQIPKDVRDLE